MTRPEPTDLTVVDAVIFDGHRRTPGTTVTIRDGVVTGIGPRPERVDGRVVDARGGLITPGFVDAHVHPTSGGAEMLAADVSGASGSDEVLAILSDYADRTPVRDGEGWIVGGGWNMGDFPGGAPRAETLDVLGDRPILLNSRDHHSAWVNSAALRLAGITAETPDPPGGVVERDEAGRPTGTLHEAAMELVSTLLPPVSEQEQREGLLAGQRYLHSFGVTGWNDAIVGDYAGHADSHDLYRAAASSGDLTAEVIGSLWWPRDVADVDAQVAAFARRRITEGPYRSTSVKFMLDGIVESRTAAMAAPYVCSCGGNGTAYFPREELFAAFRALDAAGFDIHCHAIGDRATTDALDAFEAITGRRAGGRHHIAHVQVVDPQDVPRFARLGVTANLQALWASRDAQMIDLNLPILGPERSAWQYPFADFVAAGVDLAMGSDWPVSTPDPWQAIHVAVNRTHPDAAPEPLGPEQAIDLATALSAYTSGSADLLRTRVAGRLAVGAPADLALASADPFALPATDLHTVTNRLTIAGGRVVFDETEAA